MVLCKPDAALKKSFVISLLFDGPDLIVFLLTETPGMPFSASLAWDLSRMGRSGLEGAISRSLTRPNESYKEERIQGEICP